MRSVITACLLVVWSLCAAHAADDKTATELLYDDLMGRMLQDKVERIQSDMSERQGDRRNSYREGLRGFAHKAFSSCLVWDKETLSVSYQSWDAYGSPDWSYAEFGALRACLRKKRRYNKNCTCQMIDHDDENVLKVPANFLKLYEKKLAAEQ